MIKQRYHKIIAIILLGCIMVMNMPIHNFMHNHSCKINVTKNFNDALTTINQLVDIDDCFACIINQLTHTEFAKAEQFFTAFTSTTSFVYAIFCVETNIISIQIHNKAPPIC